jgi:tetratricopeptide (TPR) repeat protein
VHWSSGFLWLLRGAAAVEAATGPTDGTAAAIERTLLWFNAPLFFAIIVLWSGWTARRAGAAAGVLMAFALFGHQRFREVFEPGYVDHHGLVNAALMGLVLGAAFMGFGWHGDNADKTRSLLPKGPREARRAATLSGVCGAIALWLSASSSISVIALTAVAGLFAAAWQGRHAIARGARFAPEVWQRWGRTGALCSGLLYLVEYAPSQFAWRLEVNHPLYSLAWWGGAEAIAMLGARGTSPAGDAARKRLSWPRLLVALGAVALPPLAILFGGAATFLASDPFVADLRHTVAESRTLPAMIRDFGVGPVLYDLASVSILAAAGWILWRRRGEGHVVLAALTVLNAVFLVMAFLVVRWWMVMSVLQIALLLWLIAAASVARASRPWMALPPSLKLRRAQSASVTREAGRGANMGRMPMPQHGQDARATSEARNDEMHPASRIPSWRPCLAAAVLLFLVPAALWMARDAHANRRRAVAAVDLFQPLYRDLAATLRASQPEGPVVVLASPNASAGIAYFGRFQSIGTLFWENAPGLRAAAQMFCAATDDEALGLIRSRGVTHVVMLPAASFVDEYFALLNPGRPRAEATRTFGHRLAADPFAGPKWLQPIPYRPPPELAGIGGEVSVFKVAPEQTEDVRLFHTALAQAARGLTDAAERSFRSALAFVPAAAHASFCGFAGEAAYEQGAHALAVRMLRHGLELRADASLAVLAGWILATSREPSVRDGAAALALIRPVALQNLSDPMAASVLAASYAELGRFEEAIRNAERALSLVAEAGADAHALRPLQERLESYRARRAWRQ